MSSKQGGGGGGYGSAVHVSKPMRQGSQRERANKTGVAQLGQRQGDHITEHGSTGYGGVPIFDGGAAYKSELGNAKAEATVCGPGGSRTVMRSGSQGTQGAPASGSPMPASNKGDLTRLDWKR